MSKKNNEEQILDEQKIKNKFFQLKKEINSLLIQRKFFFFNLMLHRFSWKIDFQCPEDCFGYIQFRNEDINEIENGTIYIGSWILNKDNFKANNLLWLLIHELMHIIFLHGPRRKNRDTYIWNIAADQVINSLIKNTFTIKQEIFPYGGYGENGGCIYYESFNGVDLKDPSLVVEDVYGIFEKKIENFEIQLSQDGNSFIITDKKTGNSFSVSLSNTKDEKEISPEEQIALQRFSRIAKEIYQNTKNRGIIPGNFREIFDKFFDSNVPWFKILEIAIRKSMKSKPNGRGWKTLNKLFLPHNYILPGPICDDESNIGVCVISIDTSGSISEENLQTFANILVESINYCEKIIIITHDTKIHQIKEFNSSNKEQLISFILSEGFSGRGGTSHKDVFDKIQELQNHSPEGLCLYLSLTDGFSDINEMWSKNNWSDKIEIPTYFILTEHHQVPRICDQNKNVKYILIK